MDEDLEELGVTAGQIVANKYRLKQLVGRGGMGSVWRCDHLTLLSEVALKVIKPKIAKNKNSLARFMREAKAAAMLRSPHVVQILDHGSDGDVAFIAMELLEGESLLQRLKRVRRLNPHTTSTVMTHVGRAIGKAHETGIVHRDLKPDNIFLIQNDDEIVAKVLDFGIAKSSLFVLNQAESPQTQTGALLGTPYYMSPEQATAQRDIVNHRADLWAMSVIAYECLLGKRPYQSDSLGELVLRICSRPQPVPSHFGDVPPGFDAWFAKANARAPDDRFQDAKSMTTALREVLKHPAVPIPRPGVPSTVSKPIISHIPSTMLAPKNTTQDPPQAPVTAQSLPFGVGNETQLPLTPLVPTDPNFPPDAVAAQTLQTPHDLTLEPRASKTAPSPGAFAEADHLDAMARVGVETLDPLAATNAPKRSRTAMLVAGVVGAVLLVGGGVLGGRWTSTPADSTSAPAARTESEPGPPTTSAPKSVPTETAAATATATASAAEATASASASAKATAVPETASRGTKTRPKPRRYRPPISKKAPPPAPPPPPPKTPDDPLGI